MSRTEDDTGTILSLLDIYNEMVNGEVVRREYKRRSFLRHIQACRARNANARVASQNTTEDSYSDISSESSTSSQNEIDNKLLRSVKQHLAPAEENAKFPELSEELPSTSRNPHYNNCTVELAESDSESELFTTQTDQKNSQKTGVANYPDMENVKSKIHFTVNRDTADYIAEENLLSTRSGTSELTHTTSLLFTKIEEIKNTSTQEKMSYNKNSENASTSSSQSNSESIQSRVDKIIKSLREIDGDGEQNAETLADADTEKPYYNIDPAVLDAMIKKLDH